MINLDYKSGATLHEQIEREIKNLVINGILKQDEQLPSVRELSIELTVNPNTVQRAYKQLEQDGFIYSIKGKGNFVAKTSASFSEKRRDEMYQGFGAIVRELAYLGEEKRKLIDIINDIYSKKEDS